MSAQIIDGTAIAAALRASVADPKLPEVVHVKV